MTQAIANDPTPAAPEPPAPPVEVTPTAEEDFVRIPKSQIPQHGFHEALRRASEYDALERDGWIEAAKQTGISGRQLMEYWNAPSDPEMTPPQTPPAEAPPQTDPQALTADSFKTLLDERLTNFRDQQRKEMEDLQTQTDRNAGLTAEGEFRNKAITDYGIAAEIDGKANRRFGMARAIFNSTLNEIVTGDIPQHWSKDRRDEALRAPASEAQLARAQETFKADMEDFHNESVAAHAEKIGEQPPTSLAGGPGGGEPDKNFETQSFEEQAATLRAMDPG